VLKRDVRLKLPQVLSKQQKPAYFSKERELRAANIWNIE